MRKASTLAAWLGVAGGFVLLLEMGPLPPVAAGEPPVGGAPGGRAGVYRVLPVSDTWGAIEGTVRIAHAVECPRLRLEAASAHASRLTWTERSSDLVVFDPETMALSGCLVGLARIDGGKDWPVPMQGERPTFTLLVHDGAVVPPLKWVRTGTGLAIVNEHTRTPVDLEGWLSPPRLVERTTIAFDVMVSQGATCLPNDDTVLTRAGLYTLECQCNGLRHLRGSVLAFDHPYMDGPTGLDGRVRLDAVPPGTYQLVCWHGPFTLDTHDEPAGHRVFEYGQPLEVSQTIVVEAKKTAKADFTLDPVR